MKNLLIAFFLIASATLTNGQIIKLDEVKEIKKGKIIVGLTGDELLDNYLKAAVKNYWNFSEVVDYIPKKTALKKASNDANLFVLSIGATSTISFMHNDFNMAQKYKTVSGGKQIEISSGKSKPMIKNFIPSFSDEKYITEEILAYGISSLQYQFETMVEYNVKSNMKLKPAFLKRSEELQSKTLYILEGWLHKKTTPEDVKKLYNYPVEVVNYEKWANAILLRKDGVAYSIVVPVPVGGNYVYQHSLVDAKTGIVFGIAQPKAGVGINGVNVSKSNTGLINEKNLKKYVEIANGKW